MQKIYVTIGEMAEQLGVSDDTIKRMVEKGELPPYTYGKAGKAKGWHVAALERHAYLRLDVEMSERDAKGWSLKNIGKAV